MKKIALTAMLGLSALQAEAAASFKFSRKVVPDKLQVELSAARFNILPDGGYIQCGEYNPGPWECVIVWGRGGETKNPTPIINAHQYADPLAARLALQAQMNTLAHKWKAGTITSAEKDG
ncbi:MAG: hypothetical protein HYZ75_08170 [Elusimicrobia bacterium]|nr:hypothetical protein [Elusimicrobiota bacterium]